MSQITLTDRDRAALAHGIALGKVRKAAAMKLAHAVLADPDRYAPLVPWAKLVLEPVLPTEQEQREAA